MSITRLEPNIVLREHVLNQSLRSSGVHINLIALHDTEGGTLAGVGAWFNNPASDASAHVCTAHDGTSATYVDSIRKAWHVAHYNSAALGIEQLGFSTDGTATWDSRPLQLAETARWIARWSIMYHIPIQHAHVSNGAVVLPGVIEHRELGALGGGHNDPGPGYPFDHVLGMAAWFKRELLAR